MSKVNDELNIEGRPSLNSTSFNQKLINDYENQMVSLGQEEVVGQSKVEILSAQIGIKVPATKISE